jgi:hypothetical protein
MFYCILLASHKSNPSSVPQSYVDLHSTLPRVTWEAVTGVEGAPCWGLRHTLAKEALQVKVDDGIVSRVPCHWGSNSSVVNNPPGDPDRTPLYVGLPSTWGSVDSDYVFPAFRGRAHFGGLRHIYIYEWINHWLWGRRICLHRDPVAGTWSGGDGAPLAGSLRVFFNTHI